MKSDHPIDNSARDSTRRLTLLYIAALSAVAVLSIAGQGLVQWQLHIQESDSRVVNIAGRQRMFSQKITKAALACSTAEPDERAAWLAELEEVLPLWKRCHAALQHGDADLELPGHNSPQVSGMFAEVEPHFAVMVAGADNFVAGAKANSVEGMQRGLQQILDHEAEYLAGMDAIVFRYDGEAYQRVERLRVIERALLCATLLVLALEGMLIFRPAVRRIRGTLGRLAISTEALRQAKEAAESANQEKSRFLANVSHELRTPMTAIIGMTELALRTEDRQRQRMFLESVDDAAESLLMLLDDLIDLSRIEAGRTQLEPKPFAPRELVERVVQLFEPTAADKQLELRYELPTEIPEVVIADPARIRQVLVNLVSNALKFTDQGRVQIRMAVSERLGGKATLELIVSDTGIGISREDQQRVFEAFTQVEQNADRRFGGVGLGLSICRRLVELFGGALWVESQPGAGSSFHFTAQVEVPPPQLAGASIESVEQRISSAPNQLPFQLPFDGLQVLVAEDTLMNQLILREMLESMGVSVTVVDRGEQAVRLAGETSFDAIFVDIQMPGLDGYDVARAIRAEEQESGRRRVPIVAISAHAMDEHRRRAIEAGMDGFAPKPLRIVALADSLAKAIQRSGAGIDPPQDASQPTSLAERKAAVLERLDGRADVLAELIELAQREVPQLLDEIEAAHQAGDRRLLGVVVHRLKGLVSNFDASPAVLAASRLETACQSEGGDLEPLLVELRDALAEFRTELRGSIA